MTMGNGEVVHALSSSNNPGGEKKEKKKKKVHVAWNYTL